MSECDCCDAMPERLSVTVSDSDGNQIGDTEVYHLDAESGEYVLNHREGQDRRVLPFWN
jgi:hypothetical protein